ncbi:MAG: hypothetical protein E4H08_08540 [Candidatus Atribacteria bacterium]|nr:MAG: hypothetical protein E4H08_08540 [Candidatus Atribacteria bacterium]
MKPDSERCGFRDSLEALRIAYSQGDAKQLHDAYVESRKTSRFLGATLPLFENVYPVRRFLAMAARLEASMAQHGLHTGCQQFFESVSIPWQCNLPESIREIAENESVIFFGNHPSLFTPFLTAACVNRPDFRFFSTKYVCNLLPTMGAASFPMEVPLTRSWTEWRRSGWQRALVYRLISLVHDMPSPEDIREGNRASLIAGANYIRQGGSAIICPGGGGKAKDRKWYAGIGSLVKQLQESSGDRTVYLLPFREENCSNKRIYAHIQNGPISRVKNAVVYRGPIRIRFAEPIPLSEVGTPEFTVQQIVDFLKEHYESLFMESALASA